MTTGLGTTGHDAHDPSSHGRLAVVTVTLNDLQGLLATRASLRRQTYREIDWIVIDGGSTDGTSDWLWVHRHEMAWWRSGPDNGIYDAMNIGLDFACVVSDVVMFLNAGDCFCNDHVSAAVMDRFFGGVVDFLYGDAMERVPGRGKMIKAARSHHLAWLGMFTHHQSMAYRTTALSGLRFDTRHTIAADYDFTLRLLRRGPRVDRIAAPLADFRLGGVSQRAAAIGRREQARIRRSLHPIATLWNAPIVIIQWISKISKTLFPSAYAAIRYKNDTEKARLCQSRNDVTKELLFGPRSGIEFSSSTNYVADESPVYLPLRARK